MYVSRALQPYTRQWYIERNRTLPTVQIVQPVKDPRPVQRDLPPADPIVAAVMAEMNAYAGLAKYRRK
jgi:hypothetical protein